MQKEKQHSLYFETVPSVPVLDSPGTVSPTDNVAQALVTQTVARQLSQLAVQSEADVTVLTGGYPTTLVTLYDRREAATVLKQDDLFVVLQSFAHTCQQQGRKSTVHHLAVLQVGRVYDLYLG